MVKVIIADDHPIVRAGLRQIVSEEPGFDASGEAGDGHELLRRMREQKYDVVLLDITMPGMNGLDTLKQLKIEYPRTPVNILTVHPETHYALRVLKSGASGYLTKKSAPDELLAAIKKVITGGKYITAALAEKIAFSLDTDADKMLHEELSDREFQVLCMIASGKTVSEIADELSLSVKTISTYRSRILEKMRMKTNAEIAYYAIKNGLVE